MQYIYFNNNICIDKCVSTQYSRTWILIMIMKHSQELVVQSSVAKINPCLFLSSVYRQPPDGQTGLPTSRPQIQQFPTSTEMPGMRRPSPLAE